MRATRSLLAVPGSGVKMAGKGLDSEVDGVFLDLEDAVAPGSKAEARQSVVRAVRDLDWRGRRVVYRINALDTAYFYRDVIEVVEAAGGALDAIMVPKVNRPEDLYAVEVLLRGVEAAAGLEPGRIKLEAQIESAEGLVNIDAIARATERLEALHFGPGDYAASLRMPQAHIGTPDEWDAAYPGDRFHYPMHRIVVAARAAGLRALDGPVADYRDEKGLRESCRRARALGFDGKWCIHPAQIAVVNEVFSPTEKEVAWAREVAAAYEEANVAGTGAISVEGRMIDAASVKMARNILDLAGSRGRPDPE